MPTLVYCFVGRFVITSQLDSKQPITSYDTNAPGTIAHFQGYQIVLKIAIFHSHTAPTCPPSVRPSFSVLCRTEPKSRENATPPRTGFHYSEKYCPVTGPERPPPRQDLLSASFKLTSLLTPSLARSGGGASAGGGPWLVGVQQATSAEMNGHGCIGAEAARGGRGGRGYAGGGGDKWAGSNGTMKPPLASSPAPAAVRTSASSQAIDQPMGRSQRFRRFGTYEREREERGLVLHYLTAATTSSYNPHGATAAGLLAAMRERPWGGRPSAGTPQEWREWLEGLEPTLERHLRWLTVDGLAARLDRNEDRPVDGGRGARFVAVLPAAGVMEDGTEAGGQELVGRLAGPSSGGKAAAGGGADGAGAAAAFGVSMLSGGVRIMKSRPIKMVKPWR